VSVSVSVNLARREIRPAPVGQKWIGLNRSTAAGLMGIEMFVWVLDVQPWVWIIGLAGGRQEDGDSVLYGNCKSWGGGRKLVPKSAGRTNRTVHWRPPYLEVRMIDRLLRLRRRRYQAVLHRQMFKKLRFQLTDNTRTAGPNGLVVGGRRTLKVRLPCRPVLIEFLVVAKVDSMPPGGVSVHIPFPKPGKVTSPSRKCRFPHVASRCGTCELL